VQKPRKRGSGVPLFHDVVHSQSSRPHRGLMRLRWTRASNPVIHRPTPGSCSAQTHQMMRSASAQATLPQQSAPRHITQKGLWYVLVKVGVYDAPAVLLADDAFILVLRANRGGSPLVRHRRVMSAQTSRSVKTRTEREEGNGGGTSRGRGKNGGERRGRKIDK
jgi:hypothetical protein